MVAEIDVADPLTMLHCLYNAKCISPAHFAAQRARLAEALDEQKPGERGDSGRKPLIVKADRFKLTEGEVILHNGAQRLFVEVVEATGTDLMFPLSEQLVSLRADILLRGARDEAGAPVRMLLTWQPQTEVLDVAMTLKNVPLAYLERIFPQLSERATSLLALGGSSTTEGSLSGAVTLVYQATAASGHKWQLK